MRWPGHIQRYQATDLNPDELVEAWHYDAQRPEFTWMEVAVEAAGQKHYVRGGKPGFYPGFQGLLPHPVTITLILALTISFTIAPRVCLALTP